MGAGSAPDSGSMTPEALIELANQSQEPAQGAQVDNAGEPVQQEQPPQAPVEAQTPPAQTTAPAVDVEAVRSQALQELSPLALRVNQILQSGGTLADVERVISVSRVDVNSISDTDAISLFYRTQHPGEDENKIAARMLVAGIDLTKLNSADPMEKAVAEVKIEEAARAAKSKILELQSQTPQAVNAEAQAAQQALQSATAQWQHVIGGINDFGRFKSAIQLPGDKQEIVNYEIPAESASEIKTAIAADLAKSGTQLNKAGLDNAQNLFNRYALALHGPEIIAAAISQAEARVRRELAGAQAGPPPAQPKHSTPKGSSAPPKLIG